MPSSCLNSGVQGVGPWGFAAMQRCLLSRFAWKDALEGLGNVTRHGGTGAQVAGSSSNAEGLCMELHEGRREDDNAMHSFATPTIALPRSCSIFEEPGVELQGAGVLTAIPCHQPICFRLASAMLWEQAFESLVTESRLGFQVVD
jgi:hypothetical protein